MKVKLIILILLAQSSIYAQNNLLFNKISQNDSLKIICVTNIWIRHKLIKDSVFTVITRLMYQTF